MPHYKNGREAKNGDTVIGKSQYMPSVLVGMIIDINPNAVSCNCALMRPGGFIQSCVAVSDFVHVDDVDIVLKETEAQVSKVIVNEASPLLANVKNENEDPMPVVESKPNTVSYSH